jgi:hypothetical protein
VIGPFVAAATLIVAIRLPDLTGLIDELVTTSSSRRTAAARSSPTS